LALQWLLLAALIALTAWVFIELTHRLKEWAHEKLPSLPARLGLGGIILVLLWQIPDMGDYLGLSTHLISQSLGPMPPPPWAFAAKLLLTAVTLGFGFIGGEVTPLFVIGACLGSAVAAQLGMPGPLAAGVGLAALFGAAANTPLAMVVMAVELLGPNVLPHVALVTVLAYMLTGQRSIYTGQRWHRVKHLTEPELPPLLLAPAPKKAARRRKA
jgi:H+/Cl- antiporter ClcA